ncbi:hypothetical protein PHPALM_30843 [Phytophthora palmivora]|uniref:Uncharacterized protein n=1 Tax=Phytophthora palmivora TaxID=4796 RepID=A0A2P4X432_9STRA|nr:hypothetical protein PHPALM_30843 [Phytophthora palmivora]
MYNLIYALKNRKLWPQDMLFVFVLWIDTSLEQNDRLPVYLHSADNNKVVETCEFNGNLRRQITGGQRTIIRCPSARRDYHSWIGGVDIHDQLRSQRYPLQLSARFRKYYKTIFLGQVDIAITNEFIRQREDSLADHGEFPTVL